MIALALGAGAVLVLIAAAAAWRWQFAVITVRGPSMAPELADGDRMLVRRCRLGTLTRGALVVFREPGRAARPDRPAWLTGASRGLWVVKRVAAVPGDPVPASARPAVHGADSVPQRALVVFGDAPGSRDSRDWGFVPARHILGVCVRKL